MSSFFGSIIFEFIGVCVRWIYYKLREKWNGEPALTFARIFNGKKNSGSREKFEYGLSNVILGIITVFVLIAIVFWIDER